MLGTVRDATNAVIPGVTVVARNTATNLTQYMQQWNFTLERELAGGMALEASYAGSTVLSTPGRSVVW